MVTITQSNDVQKNKNILCDIETFCEYFILLLLYSIN